ncbi:indolethylamine N-methyltransferase [Lingula anatina]|uniref:Indolethylamine N-methyltransferase n=1 Tax=Lingula anatina TaxID=7574 RepID=A0A1S3KHK5_LINAN|nr:indolethylamine N-methyltransferase [Lingula anatina]|eukprot:XP_013421987.1 indolethylamine N-methyltransferase [Lingula anatina]
MTNMLLFGEDYQKKFSAEEYLKSCILEGTPEEPTSPMFIPKTLHKIFSSGTITGRRILEIGSGPVIANLIPSAKWFDRITLSEYAKCNRDELVKWWAADDTAHDWSPHFKYHAKLDGDESKWMENQLTFREKMTPVKHCDVTKEDILSPNPVEPFDAVLSSLCLEAACHDVASYQRALVNIARLLRHGGHIVLVGVLDETYYTVGKEKFFCLPLDKAKITNALKSAGFDEMVWYEDNTRSLDIRSDYTGLFVVKGRLTEKN